MFLMVNKVEFGLWLQKEREKRGWTQSDLARATGKDRAVINKIESGGATPALETFIAFSSALDYSLLDLLAEAGYIPKSGDLSSAKKRLIQKAERADDQAVQIALAALEEAVRQKQQK